MKSLFKRGLLAGVSILLVGALHTSYASSLDKEFSIPEAPVVSVSDSLTAYPEYEDNLSSLINNLEKDGLDINNLLNDPRFEIYEGIGDRFRKSAERKSVTLDEYKGILGFAVKKRQIVEFMNTHADQLKKAQDTYNISPYVISAIIGVETDYGNNIGSYNPFNSYVSMIAVDYRADFARAQLKELLEFTERNSLDVLDLKSSYAGAMSFAQFIPYSLNKWFVGDDLYNMDNNILSVANYLAHFKEITGTIEKAVFRYNPSDMYTRAVLDLAQEAEKESAVSSL